MLLTCSFLPHLNELCDRALKFHAGVLCCLLLFLLVNFRAQATGNQRITRLGTNKLTQQGHFCWNIKGAFHYAKVTGQRSVGIPEENEMTFSD